MAGEISSTSNSNLDAGKFGLGKGMTLSINFGQPERSGLSSSSTTPTTSTSSEASGVKITSKDDQNRDVTFQGKDSTEVVNAYKLAKDTWSGATQSASNNTASNGNNGGGNFLGDVLGGIGKFAGGIASAFTGGPLKMLGIG